MANLIGEAVFTPHVRQLQTTDPKHPDTWNPEFKRLIDNDVWLKQFADELAAARAGAASLGDRLDGFDPDRRLLQGEVHLKNKFVINGFAHSKGPARALHISASGTVGDGVSLARTDARLVAFADQSTYLNVPTNETDEARSYITFLRDPAGAGAYDLYVGATVPHDALALYQLDVPAGNVANNLDAVTLTDLRVVQPDNGWTTSAPPTAVVGWAEPLPSADYAVAIEVIAATDPAAVGTVQAVDRATNGFTLRQTGSADNVHLRWTVLAPQQQEA